MTLAIIDGDTLCYQACRPRWQSKAKIVDNISYVQLDENGRKIPLEYTKNEDRHYLEASWENFKEDLNKMLEQLFCTDFVMAVKGDTNFRDDVYQDYKIHRDKPLSHQNRIVPALRKLAVFEGYAVAAHGREADDLVRTWAAEATAAGDDHIVCRVDKDMACIPGKHYHMKKKELLIISEEDATRHFYTQLITGDPTDHIPGVPGVGPVGAKRLLENVSTEKEMQEIVVDQYIRAYAEDWHPYLLVNGKMLYLQKNPNDYFRINDWDIVKELL